MLNENDISISIGIQVSRRVDFDINNSPSLFYIFYYRRPNFV